MIAAIGQPFLTNAPAKVSSLWYGEKGRVIATTIASVAGPVGAAIGFVLPTFFVNSDDNLEENKDQARTNIF
jgi:hypothetical protein